MSETVLRSYRLPLDLAKFLKTKANASEFIRQAINEKRIKETHVETEETEYDKTIRVTKTIERLNQKIQNILSTQEYQAALTHVNDLKAFQKAKENLIQKFKEPIQLKEWLKYDQISKDGRIIKQDFITYEGVKVPLGEKLIYEFKLEKQILQLSGGKTRNFEGYIPMCNISPELWVSFWVDALDNEIKNRQKTYDPEIENRIIEATDREKCNIEKQIQELKAQIIT